MSRLLRAFTAFVGVAVMAAATASPCAGWESTPQAREDCCRQHCQHVGEISAAGSTQASADQCCAVAERGPATRTEQLPATPIVKVASIVALASPVALTRSTSVHRGPLHPPGPVPIHLLHAVFRI